MKDFVNTHFEVLVLVFIFVFATVMLALVKSDEMARWIEGGAIITVIARSMGSRNNTPPNTTTTVSSVESTIATDPAAPKP